MPLADYIAYQVGFLPKHDAAAQKRCFNYLVDTLKRLEIEQAHSGTQERSNLISIYTNIKNLMESTHGSQRQDKAKSFWMNWDRNKERIIKMHENTDDSWVIQNVMGELEDGRYIES